MVDTKIMLLHQKTKTVELETKERKITAKLSLVKANKNIQRKKLNRLKQN